MLRILWITQLNHKNPPSRPGTFFARLGVGLLFWLALVWQLPTLAVELRVAIVEAAQQVRVGSSTSARLRDHSGQVVSNVAPRQGLTATLSGGQIQVGGVRSSRVWLQPDDGGYVQIGDRWYRGRVQLVSTSRGVTAINYVHLEDYLPSVVGKEMYVSWPQEALKAQAVASRSFVLFRRDRELRRGNTLYDVGATVTHQVYPGVSSEAPSTLAAVAATRGQVLTHNGQIIESVFHASAGGHTENSEHVWSGAVPYLRAVPDFDQAAPNYQWTVRFTAAQMRQRIPGIGNILALRPAQTTPNGRIIAMQVIGDAGSRTITGAELRRVLGLRSTLLTVNPELGLVADTQQQRSPIPVAFQITGRGHGHGLGMSQWGALALANQGYSYDQILRHYYQGIQLSSLGY